MTRRGLLANIGIAAAAAASCGPRKALAEEVSRFLACELHRCTPLDSHASQMLGNLASSSRFVLIRCEMQWFFSPSSAG